MAARYVKSMNSWLRFVFVCLRIVHVVVLSSVVFVVRIVLTFVCTVYVCFFIFPAEFPIFVCVYETEAAFQEEQSESSFQHKRNNAVPIKDTLTSSALSHTYIDARHLSHSFQRATHIRDTRGTHLEEDV